MQYVLERLAIGAIGYLFAATYYEGAFSAMGVIYYALFFAVILYVTRPNDGE